MNIPAMASQDSCDTFYLKILVFFSLRMAQ